MTSFVPVFDPAAHPRQVAVYRNLHKATTEGGPAAYVLINATGVHYRSHRQTGRSSGPAVSVPDETVTS